jgi:hypothetical protein
MRVNPNVSGGSPRHLETLSACEAKNLDQIQQVGEEVGSNAHESDWYSIVHSQHLEPWLAPRYAIEPPPFSSGFDLFFIGRSLRLGLLGWHTKSFVVRVVSVHWRVGAIV